MLIEDVTAGTTVDEHFATVPVVDGLGDIVEDTPTGDHVVFITVMFDLRDAAGREVGCLGGVGWGCWRNGEWGVVEVRGCGAEGIDFLQGKVMSLIQTLRVKLENRTYELGDGLRWQIGEELVENH